MRPLRYSINVTLDGCCDHRAIPVDEEELHRKAAATLARADALLGPQGSQRLAPGECVPNYIRRPYDSSGSSASSR